jgi:hypothetical protein
MTATAASTTALPENSPAIRDQPNRDNYLFSRTFYFSLDDYRDEESGNARL